MFKCLFKFKRSHLSQKYKIKKALNFIKAFKFYLKYNKLKKNK